MSEQPRVRTWQDVAAEAAVEKDPRRLNTLIQELCQLLDEGKMERSSQPRPDEAVA
jgi:hypothetical protein